MDSAKCSAKAYNGGWRCFGQCSHKKVNGTAFCLRHELIQKHGLWGEAAVCEVAASVTPLSAVNENRGVKQNRKAMQGAANVEEGKKGKKSESSEEKKKKGGGESSSSSSSSLVAARKKKSKKSRDAKREEKKGRKYVAEKGEGKMKDEVGKKKKKKEKATESSTTASASRVGVGNKCGGREKGAGEDEKKTRGEDNEENMGSSLFGTAEDVAEFGRRFGGSFRD
jgi:hypothetical protein